MGTAAQRAAAANASPTIVALTPLAEDPQRVRVMVRASGSARAFCAHVLLLHEARALRVRVGGQWTARLVERAATATAVAVARESALRSIARTRGAIASDALSRRLRRRGHPPHAVDAAMRQLRGDGWIID